MKMAVAAMAVSIFVAAIPPVARSTPLAALVKPDRAFVGYWRWGSRSAEVVQIFADGSVKSQRGMGVWRERSTGITIRTFEIDWETAEGGTDVIMLDTDGRRITITTSRGERLNGERMEGMRAE